MHTVRFSFYIILVRAPAWSIYCLNTGGKAVTLAYSKFNGYSARRVDFETGDWKNRLKTLLQDVIFCCVLHVFHDCVLRYGAAGWWEIGTEENKGRGGEMFLLSVRHRGLNLMISLLSTTLYSTFVASIARYQPNPPWFCVVRTFSAEFFVL